MTEIASPFAGWLAALDTVPDPVFAERMLGDGVAIDPTEGVLRAPVAGRITTIHAARHAVTIEAAGGAVLLLHIGLETVALAGAGFTALVAVGATVAKGDPLIAFDLDTVGRGAKSLVTPLILTSGEAFAIERIGGDRLVAAGEPVLRIVARGSDAVAVTESGQADAARSLAVPLRHGIHARPAARIAALACRFEARAELVATDGRAASARSPVAMLALALVHGAQVTVRARGGDASAAVAEIAALIESGMGEAAPVATPPPAAAPMPLPALLRGVTAVPGLAVGPAFQLPQPDGAIAIDAADPAAEHAALDAAIAVADARLQAQQGDGAVSTIAAAHRALLSDPELIAAARGSIGTGRSAAFAWRSAIARFVDLLGASGDRRFAERQDDLRDLERSVITVLNGDGAALSVPRGAILLAGDLLPSQLMALVDAGLAGIVTARGGPTSHAAIIAAGANLPMLVAAGEAVERIAIGTPLLLDAAAGTLAIDPPSADAGAALDAQAEAARFRIAAQAHAHEPAMTRDGQRIDVVANLGSLADAQAAVDAGAEGCGLLRTEFLFLDRDTAPSEDEQHASYQAIADALARRPMIVRTLDIGADKPAVYLPMPPEDNPALGLRGLRLGLSRPDVLRAQLRALVRVDGAVRIMLPMVTDLAELAAARALLDEAAAALGRSAPPLGIMVETPAAALLADRLARDAAFFSIGSNDLSQYALARDRGNPAVAAGLDALHPAVLRLIAMTASGGAAHGRWTGVCGGLAADAAAVAVLIGLGVTELSVPVGMVAETKARVRRLDLEDCRAVAAEAVGLDDAVHVRALVGRADMGGQA